jgi:hypothetical protein
MYWINADFSFYKIKNVTVFNTIWLHHTIKTTSLQPSYSNLLWCTGLPVIWNEYLAKLEVCYQTCSHSQQVHNKLSRPAPCCQCLQFVANLASSRSGYVRDLAALESLDMTWCDSCCVSCNRTAILTVLIIVICLIQFMNHRSHSIKSCNGR